jgi:hypothetical protein
MANNSFTIPVNPSLSKPQQLTEYAGAVEALLRQLYPPYSGYKVEKKADEIMKGEWHFAIFHGWSSGVLVKVSPYLTTPDNATVSVSWHPRVKHVTKDAFTKLVYALGLIYMVVGMFFARIIILLLALIPYLIVCAIFIELLQHLVGKLISRVAGENQFDDDRRAELLERLRQIPAPTAPSSKQASVASFAGN